MTFRNTLFAAPLLALLAAGPLAAQAKPAKAPAAAADKMAKTDKMAGQNAAQAAEPLDLNTATKEQLEARRTVIKKQDHMTGIPILGPNESVV